MSVLELLGIIRLSFRQAEGRRTKNAVLCLKYILMLSAASGLTVICIRTEHPLLKPATALFAAASALCAVLFRGMLVRENYLLSESFLISDSDGIIPLPGAITLLSGELVFQAAIWTVFAVLLCPSILCFRSGVSYYSLSSDRKGFLLLLAASMLLAAGGVIFSFVTYERLSCAEYLLISGKCGGMLSALNCSWELTRGVCGDLLRLDCITAFCGISLSCLSKINLCRKQLRKEGMPSSQELLLAVTPDIYGEQQVDIIIARCEV